MIFIDFVNNDPDENEAKKLVKKINNMTNQDPNIRALESYFSIHEETSKTLAMMFYKFLNSKGEVSVETHRTKVDFDIGENSFSVIGYSGKGGRKCFLQLNTDFDVTKVSGLLVEDRVRPNMKKKGSLGNERYEVFLQNEQQMKKLITFLDGKL